MHEYYFKIRKGDIEFEFSTTDKFTFEQQLSDWINGVVRGDYVSPPTQEGPPAQNGTHAQEEDSASKEYFNLTLEQSETGSQEIQQNPQPERSGFINVKNLTSINEITTPTFEMNKQEPEQELPSGGDFEKTLEESIQNPKTEVKEKPSLQSDFADYLHSYSPQCPLDNLIVTAKYILGVENQERFTIKQINAKLVPASGTPVDHGVIENAISQNLIRLVPDLTGTSDFTEYTLTDEGEHYFID